MKTRWPGLARLCPQLASRRSAVIPMLGCTIQIMYKFGVIIPVCIVLSLFYSLHMFVP